MRKKPEEEREYSETRDLWDDNDWDEKDDDGFDRFDDDDEIGYMDEDGEWHSGDDEESDDDYYSHGFSIETRRTRSTI